mgnify:CR=1 FL=1
MTSCCHCVQAAELAGYKLLLALCDREARPRGRDMFFVDQLVGLKAMDAASGTLVGIVTEVGKRIGPGVMLTWSLASALAVRHSAQSVSTVVLFTRNTRTLETGLHMLSLWQGLSGYASTGE